MKRIAAFMLTIMLAGMLAAGCAVPLYAAQKKENRSIGENQAEAKRAAKRYKKYSNKQAKQHQKAMKKYQKAQKKALKREQRKR